MDFTKCLLIALIIVPLLALLIQEYLIVNINRNLSEIEAFSEQTKLVFEKSLKEEKFEIEYDEAEWNYLVKKLNNTRYFKPLKNAKRFDFGFNVDYAKELIEYWMNKFDWKKQVAVLNKYTHYRIKFNDLTLHYLRIDNNPKRKGE